MLINDQVSFACYHPELPLIISGSEDGTVKLWHSSTYKLEQSLNYGLERAWCVSYQRQKQHIAIGYDDGMVVLKMGREQPAVSMDSSGKIISAKANDIVTTTIKSSDIANVKDGDRIVLPLKELGTTELYPQSLMHSPNGRFVAVCGDGEWLVLFISSSVNLGAAPQEMKTLRSCVLFPTLPILRICRHILTPIQDCVYIPRPS